MAQAVGMAQMEAVGMAQAVVRGAQVCVAHWVAQGEADMVAEAQARLDRVLDGTANEVDIEGALDWLDMVEEAMGILMARGWDEVGAHEIVLQMMEDGIELTEESVVRTAEDYEDR